MSLQTDKVGKLQAFTTDRFTKSKKTGVSKNVIECYIRNDISCKIKSCTKCQAIHPTDSNLLDLSSKELFILGVDVASRYIVCLEWPEIANILISQTVTDALRSRDRMQSIKALHTILKAPNRAAIFFTNTIPCVEHTQENFSYLKFSDYVKTHIPKRYTEFKNVEASTEGTEMDITSMNLEQFIRHKAQLPNPFGFSRYLSSEELEEGYAMKAFVKGKIKFKSMTTYKNEKIATVELGGQDPGTVWIVGNPCINRSVDGDTVYVKILSKAQVAFLDIFETDNSSINKNIAIIQPIDDYDDEKTLGLDNYKVEVGDEVTDEVFNPKVRNDKLVYGKVVGIAQRSWRPYVATLQVLTKNASMHMAVPLDINVPKINMFYLNKTEIEDYRFLVVIDDWPIGSRYPTGHFVRKIGKIGSLDTEIDALLIEHGISSSQSDLVFSQNVMNEMPVLNDGKTWKPEYSQIGRKDLRKKVIFSIDPVGSKDIDDAISFEETKNAKTGETEFEFGVHIADVTQFLINGSEADKEAKRRGTTIYLADRRFNMIPEILSENICSLRANNDRYAVSVMWKLDSKYQTKSVWFGRTLINSSAELCYESAQLSRRMERGALELESTEVKFVFNKDNTVSSANPKQKLEIHSVIEEAMVMANCSVASRILEGFSSSSMIRIHSNPIEEKFEEVESIAKFKGFDLDVSSNLALSTSLKIIQDAVSSKDNSFIRLLKSMTVLALSEASYVSSGTIPSTMGYSHYGLAVDAYTHFTSPIRRYADIVVHRQLLELLQHSDKEYLNDSSEQMDVTRIRAKGQPDIDELGSNKFIQELADHLNKKNRMSKKIQRASTLLFQSKYIMDLYATYTEESVLFYKTAVITKIYTHGFKANIPELGMTGMVPFKRMAQGNPSDETSYFLPLSLFTSKSADIETYIPFCKIKSFSKTSIVVKFPEEDKLSPPFLKKMFTNEEKETEYKIVTQKEYLSAVKTYTSIKTKDGSKSRMIREIEMEFRVFEPISVSINISKSEFRWMEPYFCVLSKSELVGTSSGSLNLVNMDSILEKKSFPETRRIKTENGNVETKTSEKGVSSNTVQNTNSKNSKHSSFSAESSQLYSIIDKFRLLSITEHEII
ncbi:hypothetical protein BB560_003723 [Smittium megazygosporum]|uniref:DIS3-like exonuclease 1 n=1 Tax=Smittium megazygosporum TaxID=133381 RepID=A0A2T9ZB92_9FUNG|nr:hypothetical protein BB560_003723 [Smittium megazygosporum]